MSKHAKSKIFFFTILVLMMLAFIVYVSTTVLREEYDTTVATVVRVYDERDWDSTRDRYETNHYIDVTYDYGGSTYTVKREASGYEIGDQIEYNVNVNNPRDLRIFGDGTKMDYVRNQFIIASPFTIMMFIVYIKSVRDIVKRDKRVKEISKQYEEGNFK